MSDSKQGNTNMMFGLLFTLIAVVALIALVLTRSQADNVSSTASVTNATPSIDNVYVTVTSGQASTDASIALTAASTKTVYVRGQASDNNGCEDINDADGVTENYTMKFYRTNVASGSACNPDNLNCYAATEADGNLSGCTAGGSDLNIIYEFSVPVEFYADATDAGTYSATTWTGYVQVADTAGLTANSSATTEIATLSALSMATTSVDYSGVALGGTSSAQTVTVNNKGNNNAFDPQVSMSANWTCTIGTIDKANTKWDTASGGTYSNVMSATPASIDLNVPKQTTAASSPGSFYTKLTIPSTGVGGSCSSTLIVGA